jgi:hypothetical protein
LPAEHFHSGRNVAAIEQRAKGTAAVLDDGLTGPGNTDCIEQPSLNQLS